MDSSRSLQNLSQSTLTTFMHHLRDDYAAEFFRSVSEFHDQQIEWQLPHRLPPEVETRYQKTQNPEGITQGPPAGRHGMTPSGS
jgi:hypothetical protein